MHDATFPPAPFFLFFFFFFFFFFVFLVLFYFVSVFWGRYKNSENSILSSQIRTNVTRFQKEYLA